MGRLGFKSVLYHGDLCLGELETAPSKNHQNFKFPNNEVRISHISQPSERCPPLSILQTISPFAVRCKLKSTSVPEHSPLYRLHAACFHERKLILVDLLFLKTAVVLLGEEELHLVAMVSKQEKVPCFWCCSVSVGLYGSCLGLLNLRCLAIVFDLDETLIVANSMKSFEDRIEALQRRIGCENDPFRVSGMSAEVKRYMEDKMLLKQYSETDTVMDNGKLLKVQPEEVPALSNNESDKVFRPIIRLPEKNIVLTRINPEIRDTSVLVRLRPAWEDLRSYLTAKGRKRFEVYVCTMAERDYALEMWRLLDPEAHLISLKQLMDRSYSYSQEENSGRKSLLSVFQDGICHPKMAMVIDDRLNVWEEKDQPRVHVVPPFAPYYAPQAEIAHPVPVLCVARNVACNVRAGFFKIFELFFEDEVANLPYAPDVSDYLMSEDTLFVPNGSLPISEGMNGAEVERRVTRPEEKQTVANGSESKTETSQQPVIISPNPTSVATCRPILPLQSMCRGSGRHEVNPSEMDPDIRRKLLISQHAQEAREQSLGDPSLLSRPSTQVSTPPLQPHGGWLVEENSSTEQLNNRATGPIQEPGAPGGKEQSHHKLFNPTMVVNLAYTLAHLGHEVLQKQNHSQASLYMSSGNELVMNQAVAKSRDPQSEGGKVTLPSSISVGVLQEIGQRCGSKVEFRSVVGTSKDLQFSVEVLFSGERIGVGMGKTKKDAQQQAAENALHNLADKYVEHSKLDSRAGNGELNKPSHANENGFIWDADSPGRDEVLPNRGLLNSNATTHLLGLKNSLLGLLMETELKLHSPHKVSDQESFLVHLEADKLDELPCCSSFLSLLRIPSKDGKIHKVELLIAEWQVFCGGFVSLEDGSRAST
ncbi:hypothetical protein Sjap_014074 [Stephania japonica]|uniref:protein-serine/threonine phosphatase n=1 Tax=Stephania japonica TaxID=461633 RepID=A0AAP0J154_9MAGN